MNDTASFLLKVLFLSAGLSFLIKLGGPSLAVQTLNVPALSRISLIIIVLPSLTVGAFLLIKSRS